MNRRITVTLVQAAKIDGQDHKAGAQVETTLGTALQLVEMGVIAALPPIDPPPVVPGEDPGMASRARAMAETMVGAATAQAMTELTAERDNALRRADDLVLQVAALTAERDALAERLRAAAAETTGATAPDAARTDAGPATETDAAKTPKRR